MLSLFSIILRYKRTVVLVTLTGFVVSALVSLIIPPRYIASASILPIGVEKEITGRRGFLYHMGSFGAVYATFLRVRRNFIIESMLRSRRMSDLLSERFGLEEVYNVSGADEVNRRLQERTSIWVKDEGVVVIKVEDRSPERVLAIIGTYIHNLDSLLVEMTIGSARERRSFLEMELVRREKRIASLDSAMTMFMEEHGIYEIEQQTRAALQVTAAMNARISILEVEKRLLEMTLKAESPELERLNSEIEKIREQLLEVKEGGEGDFALFPPLDEFPALSKDYVGLLDERKTQEFTLAYIRFMLEDAKISEIRRESVIHVIDPPVLPEKRIWPRRKQIVIISTIAVLFWTCFFLLVRQRWREGIFKGAFNLSVEPIAFVRGDKKSGKDAEGEWKDR